MKKIVLWFILVASFIGFVHTYESQHLTHTHYLTGWLLFFVIMVLLLIARFRCYWSRLHVYLGWFSLVLFALHFTWHWPESWVTSCLLFLFSVIVLTGIWGLLYKYAYSSRFTRSDEYKKLDQLAEIRKQLRQEAEKLVLASIKKTGKQELADFYQKIALDFFIIERSTLYILWKGRIFKQGLKQSIQKISDFPIELQPDYKQLIHLLKQKQAIEYRYAKNRGLASWGILHIPLSFVLVGFILLHIIVIASFTGRLW